jgi:hypothetical protein
VPPGAGSAHDLAYLLYRLRDCGRHLGGQLGAEAEVAADYGKDHQPAAFPQVDHPARPGSPSLSARVT